MTDLMRMYAEQRTQGRVHHAVLRVLARRLDLDKDTVARVLRSAEDDHGPAWVDSPHPARRAA